MNIFRLRSKSASRRQEAPAAKLPLQPSYSVNVPSHGIPIIKPEKRRRANSYVVPISATPDGVYYAHEDAIYHPRYSPPRDPRNMSAGYSPQMMLHHSPHYFAQGQVVYHHVPGAPVSSAGYDSSPQSLYLDSHARGRPRSNTSTAAREKLTMASNAPEAVRMPLAGGYVPGYGGHPPSHEAPQKSGGIFGSIVNAVRSRSKSRERDALFSASNPKVALNPNPSRTSLGDSRGRPQYDLKRQQQMLSDVDAEIARRLEKDLRLQDLEDPYRSTRRDRSRSFESTRSRERAERRNRDLDPDVQDNTRYNAKALHYHTDRPTASTRLRPERGSGYHTDAQPSALRRSNTAGHHPSSRSGNPAAPKGWFNARGDQLVGKNSVIRQPHDREYQPCFSTYPAVGTGYGDSLGNIIDLDGRVLKRVG